MFFIKLNGLYFFYYFYFVVLLFSFIFQEKYSKVYKVQIYTYPLIFILTQTYNFYYYINKIDYIHLTKFYYILYIYIFPLILFTSIITLTYEIKKKKRNFLNILKKKAFITYLNKFILPTISFSYFIYSTILLIIN